MLLDRETLAAVERGDVTLAFRRWRRPTVKAGGTLLTAIGQLAIEAVDPVDPEAITPEEARAAGFPDPEALRDALASRTVGSVYRIRLARKGPDPRIALRRTVPEGAELQAAVERVRALGSRSAGGPWGHRILSVIDEQPEVSAKTVAEGIGLDRTTFKTRVRKLKRLGLTESLKVGYRLSPRGRAVLAALGDEPPPPPASA